MSSSCFISSFGDICDAGLWHKRRILQFPLLSAPPRCTPSLHPAGPGSPAAHALLLDLLPQRLPDLLPPLVPKSSPRVCPKTHHPEPLPWLHLPEVAKHAVETCRRDLDSYSFGQVVDPHAESANVQMVRHAVGPEPLGILLLAALLPAQVPARPPAQSPALPAAHLLYCLLYHLFYRLRPLCCRGRHWLRHSGRSSQSAIATVVIRKLSRLLPARNSSLDLRLVWPPCPAHH
jgi:hypothetical protein